ncbi:hypothetical protein HK098_000433 [Nowakowskiella sp. JEL0407]|nr:hypothetical protein HK098_000433 [Nowakowskiella sp. JEL0407]
MPTLQYFRIKFPFSDKNETSSSLPTPSPSSLSKIKGLTLKSSQKTMSKTYTDEGIVIDFLTGCNSSPALVSHIPPQYPIIALLNLQTDYSASFDCPPFSIRLQNTISASPKLISLIYNEPAISTSESAIASLSQSILNASIPIFAFADQGFKTVVAETLGTIGVSDISKNYSDKALIGNITFLDEASNSDADDGSVLRIALVVVGVILLLTIPFSMYFAYLYVRGEKIRREREVAVERLVERRRLREEEDMEQRRIRRLVVTEEELSMIRTLNFEDVEGVEHIFRSGSAQSEKSFTYPPKGSPEMVELNNQHSKRNPIRYFSNIKFWNSRTNNLPTTTFESIESGFSDLRKAETDAPSCSICLDAFEQSSPVRQLHCRHVFHSECIDSWLLNRSRFCPLCRNDAVNGVHESEVLDQEEENDEEEVEQV